MKNLFLTGPVNTGKSTVVSAVLSAFKGLGIKIGGFYTLPYIANGSLKGFYMEPVNFSGYVPEIKERLIAYTDGFKWHPVIETFQGLGVQILEQSLEGDVGLVVMDELGFFETKAISFQEKVMEVLSGKKPVIGVIKPLSTPFLDSIRNRGDTKVIEVTLSNRDILPREIAKTLRREMGLWDSGGPGKA